MTRPRTGTRHRRRIRVTIGVTPTFTLNLGVGGFSAELMRVLPCGTPVRGTIRLAEEDLDYTGEVAWVKPGDSRVNLRGRMGIRFTSLAPEAMRLIGTSGFVAGQ
jgi:hypothetical protein